MFLVGAQQCCALTIFEEKRYAENMTFCDVDDAIILSQAISPSFGAFGHHSPRSDVT